jgi:hypothetical protein
VVARLRAAELWPGQAEVRVTCAGRRPLPTQPLASSRRKPGSDQPSRVLLLCARDTYLEQRPVSSRDRGRADGATGRSPAPGGRGCRRPCRDGEEELVAAGVERALADQSSSVGAQLLGSSPQALGDLGTGELSPSAWGWAIAARTRVHGGGLSAALGVEPRASSTLAVRSAALAAWSVIRLCPSEARQAWGP